MSNLAIRVLVAVIAIPLILLLTMAGGFYFFGFVAILSLLALREFFGIAGQRGANPQIVPGFLLSILLNGIFFYQKGKYTLLGFLAEKGIAVPFPTMAQWLLIVLLTFIPLMLIVELFRGRGSALLNVSTTITGALYVSFFLGTLIGLRELFVPEDFPVYRFFDVQGIAIPDQVSETIYRWGGFTVVAVFASVWVCDSAAYFAGRAFGKHKLFERVSPRKTWEGAIAGFFAAVLAFLLAAELLLPYMTVVNAIVCGAIVGGFGQIGDLVESLFKRDAGVKDSSSLIPGHGGVLDRFDSVLFISPMVFLYLDFIVF